MPFPLNILNGLAQPITPVPPNRNDLLDYTNMQTIDGARWINPITQDFSISSTNHLQGMNAVDQEVILAMNTTLNSSVLNGFGQGFSSIKMINTDTLNSQVEAVINNALKVLIGNGNITLQSVKTANNVNGQIFVQFLYTNNTSGVSSPVQFKLR